MSSSQFPFAVVAFDLDGTLLDTAPDLTAALNHALGELDRPAIAPDRVRSMFGRGLRELLRQGLEATGEFDTSLLDRGLPLFHQYYSRHIADRTVAFPGVEAALTELQTHGVALAICTNKLESLAIRLIEAIGWRDRFAAIVGGDTLSVRKPDAAPLLEAIARAGGGRAAFVGDSIVDADAARAATIPCVCVTFGFRDRPAEALGADILIDHFGQLVPALRRLRPNPPPSQMICDRSGDSG